MKVRMGFISNSSSGSFIMHWRMRTMGKEVTKERAIGLIFGSFFKDDGSGSIDWENTWNKDRNDVVRDAMDKTDQNMDGSFTTTFWTSMVNSGDDFGETAKSMLICLMTNEDNLFEIIDTKTEGDY